MVCEGQKNSACTNARESTAVVICDNLDETHNLATSKVVLAFLVLLYPCSSGTTIYCMHIISMHIFSMHIISMHIISMPVMLY